MHMEETRFHGLFHLSYSIYILDFHSFIKYLFLFKGLNEGINMGLVRREKAFEHAQKCAFTSSCACAKSHPGFCSLLILSMVSNDLGSGQRMPLSDCASARSSLSAYSPKTQFHFGTAHIILSGDLRLLVSSCLTSNRKLIPEVTGHRTRLYLY